MTLNPVTTRIDEDVRRTYKVDVEEPEDDEVEMTLDENVEPLPANIDLYSVMIEALSLAMPAYPRAEGAELGDAVFSDRGIAPMSDDDAKPFAGLKGLRKALEKKGD